MRLSGAIRTARGAPGSLRARALGAGAWSMGGMAAGQALRLASNLMMTRLLVPEAFGLMAMVVTVHMALTMLSDIGVDKSVVRDPRGEEPHFLRVAWTVQALRSAVIAALVVAAAGLLALTAPHWAPPESVYADPRLPPLIAVSALVVLMRGFEPATLHVAKRRMRLARLTALDLGCQAAGLAAMLGLALAWPSVWALLAGMLVASAARLVTAHLLFPTPRAGFAWDPGLAAEMWRYGRWLIGSSLATYVANNADRLILGGLLDKESFGFYVIAALWIQAGVDVLHRLGARVIFPALNAARREGPSVAARALARVRTAVDLLCLAGFAFLLVFGAAFIDLLYPEAYLAAGGYLSLLSFRVLLQRYQPLRMQLLARGDSLSVMLITALRAALLCAALPLAFSSFGLPGALLTIGLVPLVEAPFLLRRAAREGPPVPAREWLFMALVPACALLVWSGWT